MEVGAEAPTPPPKSWFGHPGGLLVPFLTEMWERFSFYGMRAMLVKFLIAVFPLLLIVVGTGLLKPNISAMVGELYDKGPELAENRRDAGFTLFYPGINLGAFIAPLITGWVCQEVGYHQAFAIAAAGMTIAVIQYVLGAGWRASGSDRPQRGWIRDPDRVVPVHQRGADPRPGPVFRVALGAARCTQPLGGVLCAVGAFRRVGGR